MTPGQLTYEQMTQIYRYDQINAETEVYGVIADPVGHSLSPQIHNAAFAREKLNKVHVPIRARRAPWPVHRRCRRVGDQGAERDDSTQGGGAAAVDRAGRGR